MNQEMTGKICLITGATSGIGLETARVLANQGAAIIGIGRDRERCRKTAAEIRSHSNNTEVEFLLADLSVLDQVRRLAGEIRENYSRLDVLVNNAGAFFLRRKVTKEGIEKTWALNQLNYFLLTNLLLDLLASSPQGRVVNVASGAHYSGQIFFDDLNLVRGYNGWKAYCQSKLANVMFTYHLARLVEDSNISVNSLTPGFVATRIGHNSGRAIKPFVQLVQKIGAMSPQEGADTIVYLSAAPEVAGITGKYFLEKKSVRSSSSSYDLAAAERLWNACEMMTGFKFDAELI